MVGIINCIRISECSNKDLIKSLYDRMNNLVGITRDNRLVVASNVFMRQLINHTSVNTFELAIIARNYETRYTYTMIINDI